MPFAQITHAPSKNKHKRITFAIRTTSREYSNPPLQTGQWGPHTRQATISLQPNIYRGGGGGGGPTLITVDPFVIRRRSSRVLALCVRQLAYVEEVAHTCRPIVPNSSQRVHVHRRPHTLHILTTHINNNLQPL